MKTILVPIEYNAEQNAPIVSALDTALLLAKKFESCIEGFPLRPAVADMLAMDPDAGLTMVAVKENDADMVRQAESLFHSFMERNNVPRRTDDAAAASLSWTWLPAAPSGHEFVGSYGRVFDIIVLARPGGEWQSPAMVTLEFGVVRKRPPGFYCSPDVAALAWRKRSGLVEPLDRTGPHDGFFHAAPSPCRAHHDSDRRRSDRCRTERR